MKLLNSFFGLLLITLLAACSSTNGGHTNNARFGTWNKVSATRGDYVGISNLPGRAALGGIQPLRGAADTTAIDTSFVNSTGRFSFQITPITYNNDYTFALNITDSARHFDYHNATASYITDSTALHFQFRNSFENKGNRVSIIELWFTNNCKGVQAANEYLIVDMTGDSTEHEVLKVRVDGMKKIAKNLVASCH